MQVHAAVACAGDGGTHAVAYRECRGALLLGFLEGCKRIGGFTGLADGEYERAGLDDGVPVAELGGIFHLDGHACQILDHVFADHARIVACAAGGDNDAVDVPQFLDVRVEAREFRVPFGGEQAAAHGIAEHFRLLENFFQHEVREPALRNGVRIEFHILNVALDFVAVHVHDGVGAALYLNHVVVIEIDDLLRVVDDCGYVACEEKFGVGPDAQDERASAACPDKRARFLAADDGKAERTLDLGERLEDGGLEVAVIESRDEMGDDFGICFGLELYAFGDEFRLEGRVVLDDAVVDDGNLAVEAHVRVRIRFGRCTVRCPAGVRDADGTADRMRLELVFKGAYFARSTDNFNLAVVDEGDSRAVVSAVFKFLESAHQDG